MAQPLGLAGAGEFRRSRGRCHHRSRRRSMSRAGLRRRLRRASCRWPGWLCRSRPGRPGAGRRRGCWAAGCIGAGWSAARGTPSPAAVPACPGAGFAQLPRQGVDRLVGGQHLGRGRVPPGQRRGAPRLGPRFHPGIFFRLLSPRAGRSARPPARPRPPGAGSRRWPGPAACPRPGMSASAWRRSHHRRAGARASPRWPAPRRPARSATAASSIAAAREASRRAAPITPTSSSSDSTASPPSMTPSAKPASTGPGSMVSSSPRPRFRAPREPGPGG